MDEVRRLLDAAQGSALPALRSPAPTAPEPALPLPAGRSGESAVGSPARLAHPVGFAAGLLAVAGIIHLVVLPQHLAEARGIGLYFCAIGAAQVVWALLFVLQPTRRLAWVGLMAFAVQPVAVYVLTRLVRQPFGDHAEAVDLIGTVTGLMEVLALGPFALYLSRTRRAGATGGRAVAMPLATAIAVGLLFGVALYGIGLVAEDLVPWLDEPEAAHGEGHLHGDATDLGAAPPEASAAPAHSHGTG